MDFSIERDSFFKVLQKINNIIEEKVSPSISSNFLVKASHNYLEITAISNEIGFRDSIAADIKSDGIITLSARKIYDIVREIPSTREISFVVEDTGKVLIKADRASFHLSYLPADTYPLMPEFTEEDKVSLPVADLTQLLGKTFYAISADETKRALHGLNFILGNKFVQAVATDGHRMALVRKSSTYEFENERSFIVPRKGVAELRRLLAEYTGGEVELNFLENMIILRKDNHIFFTRLLEGEFPEVSGVMSLVYDKQVLIDRDALSHALRRVSLMSNEINRLVSFTIQPDSLLIESGEADLGDATETVPATYSNEPITLGFNARYLLEALANIDESEVIIKLIDPGKSTRIQASNDEDAINVVMPMRL